MKEILRNQPKLPNSLQFKDQVSLCEMNETMSFWHHYSFSSSFLLWRASWGFFFCRAFNALPCLMKDKMDAHLVALTSYYLLPWFSLSGSPCSHCNTNLKLMTQPTFDNLVWEYKVNLGINGWDYSRGD